MPRLTKDLRSKSRIYTKLAATFLAVIITVGFSSTVYASSLDIDFIPGAEYVTTANLNLRTGPSTDHDRVTLIPSGGVVFVLNYVPDIDDEYTFSRVMFGEVTGYVATRYIEPRPFTPFSETAPVMPVATQTTGNATPSAPPTINGDIHKMSWWTMRDTGVIPIGTTIQIYDIRTGLTYYVRNFSNGNHADVETLTQHDTNVMRQTSGGVYSWDARPVLATFNGQTHAAAIHTMPHAGSTITDNGMNGHICLHFFESTPHNGNQSWRAEMQAAVMQSFNFR
ncbi:MAG: SH3 domain-containing protein [Defluviitaleaceae bacterium]|nr:SH3 domain-containing protein [Defluviitaleaceae bacterium]